MPPNSKNISRQTPQLKICNYLASADHTRLLAQFSTSALKYNYPIKKIWWTIYNFMKFEGFFQSTSD